MHSEDNFSFCDSSIKDNCLYFKPKKIQFAAGRCETAHDLARV